MEIEAKYILSEEDYHFWRKAQAEKKALGLWSVRDDSRRRILMHSVYFDNREAELYKRKIGLRLRSENERLVFTMKQTVERSGASSTRHEWEEEIAGEIEDGSAFSHCLERLDELSLEDPILAEAWRGIEGASLVPVASMRFERRLCLLEKDGTRAEWALDYGTFSRETFSEPFAEMEVEIKAGDPSKLDEVEAELLRLRPLVPGKLSKLERCLLIGRK